MPVSITSRFSGSQFFVKGNTGPIRAGTFRNGIPGNLFDCFELCLSVQIFANFFGVLRILSIICLEFVSAHLLKISSVFTLGTSSAISSDDIHWQILGFFFLGFAIFQSFFIHFLYYVSNSFDFFSNFGNSFVNSSNCAFGRSFANESEKLHANFFGMSTAIPLKTPSALFKAFPFLFFFGKTFGNNDVTYFNNFFGNLSGKLCEDLIDYYFGNFYGNSLGNFLDKFLSGFLQKFRETMFGISFKICLTCLEIPLAVSLKSIQIHFINSYVDFFEFL